MALASTARGSGSLTTSSTTMAITPASYPAAGNLLVLVLAHNNSGAAGIAPTTQVTDSQGNTWTKSHQTKRSAANAANDGTVLEFWHTHQNIGTLVSANTITVTYITATASKTWALWEATAAAGSHAEFAETGTGAVGASTTPSVTTASIPSGDMVIAAVANEYGTAQTLTTPDADTTNGSWSTNQYAEIGTTAAGTNVTTQTKVVNATGAQTYNLVMGTSTDWAAGWVVIDEVADSAAATWADTVTALSPSAWWRFDEASGNFTDAIASLVATPTGTPTYGVTSPITGDTADKAITLVRASSQLLTVSDNAALDQGDTFTVLVWLKRVSVGTNQTVADRGSTSWLIFYNTSNQLRLATSGAGAVIVDSAVDADTSAWHMRGFTKAAAVSRSYRDQHDTTVAGTNATLSSNTSSLFVGREAGGGTNFLDASIDELIVFPTALTHAQWTALWDSRTVSAGAPVTVTPTTAALTLATFAPTVPITNHQLVTPTTKALTLATFAPTVTATNHQTVTPTTRALTVTRFAPTITTTNHQLVTPTTRALVTATFAPTIGLTNHQLVTPTTRAVTLTTFAPGVTLGIRMTPAPAGLTLTAFAPVIGVSAHITVTPPSRAVLLTAFAPGITVSDHRTYTPTTRALTLTAFAPSIGLGIRLTPTTRALSLTAFAPGVTASDHRTYTPLTAALLLAAFAPTATVADPTVAAGPPPPASAYLDGSLASATFDAPAGRAVRAAPAGRAGTLGTGGH